MLVGDVADDGLDQVLDRHQPVDAAIFVDHQGEMDAAQTHLQQQVQHRGLRRDHQRLPQDRLQPEALARTTVGDQILDVHHPDHVVELLAIDRQAGMVFPLHRRQRLVETDRHRHRHDVGARHHHVVRGGAAQAQHVGDQNALLTVQLRQLAVGLRSLCGLPHQGRDPRPQILVGALAGEPAQHARAARFRPLFVAAHRSGSGEGGDGRGFHGFGTPRRCRILASCISMRRASPTRW